MKVLYITHKKLTYDHIIFLIFKIYWEQLMHSYFITKPLVISWLSMHIYILYILWMLNYIWIFYYIYLYICVCVHVCKVINWIQIFFSLSWWILWKLFLNFSLSYFWEVSFSSLLDKLYNTKFLNGMQFTKAKLKL